MTAKNKVIITDVSSEIGEATAKRLVNVNKIVLRPIQRCMPVIS